MTPEQRAENLRLSLIAEANAKKVLKPGDRLRVTKCPGTKRWITFASWDGHWIVSKSGIADYSPRCVDRVNQLAVDFTKEAIALPDLYMVFDVEAIGLHGEGFAVGWVVIDRAGQEHDSGLLCCSPDVANGSDASRKWVKDNVPPMKETHSALSQMRASFWAAWRHWALKGAVLVADCCWPVETRFLAACVDDDHAAREWSGPFPLHDLASVQLAMGGDPVAAHERQPRELPPHQPLNDARQSARLLAAALAAHPL